MELYISLKKELFLWDLKTKLAQSYTNAYLNKYGDRLTQLQGRVLSIKSETKSFIGILNWITVTIVLKPEAKKYFHLCL